MRNVARQFWTLAAPYWRSEERWKSGVLLFAVVGLNLASVYILVLINLWYADFYNALQEKDFPAYSHQLLRFTLLAALYIVTAVYRIYLRQMLQIRWRKWMTEYYAHRWLEHDAFYRLQLSRDATDNPDQRIQQDINIFVEQTLLLSLGILDAVVSLFSFAAILWGLSGTIEVYGFSIPGYMLWAAVAYSILGSWFMNRIGKPLVTLNYKQQQYEADLRFSLVRLRENAEGVALYGGEASELGTVSARFANVVSNWWGIMLRLKTLTWFSACYSQAAIIFPFVVAAPRYFSGAFQLGQLMQTAQAFDKVQSALSWFVTNYSDLADWKATVNRLSGFEDALSEVENVGFPGIKRTGEPGGRELSVSDTNIYLPDGAPLLTSLNLQIPSASRVLVSGPSGAGKSTLLRALSGIWPYCEGNMRLPDGDRTLFFPQKPYLPLGTLKDSICYPGGASSHGADDVEAALSLCGLPALAPRLDEHANWAMQLSPGEQQRVAFARALLLRPQWLFLDEATSALDEETEAMLYAALIERLDNCAIVSVAHRSSLARFHGRKIVFAVRAEADGARTVTLSAGAV